MTNDIDDVSILEERIIKLKKRKEKIQTKKALLLFKEAENILGKKFSCELSLSILSNSWNSSSDKQKEEWIKSAESFRKFFKKRKSKRAQPSQSENNKTPAETP